MKHFSLLTLYYSVFTFKNKPFLLIRLYEALTPLQAMSVKR